MACADWRRPLLCAAVAALLAVHAGAAEGALHSKPWERALATAQPRGSAPLPTHIYVLSTYWSTERKDSAMHMCAWLKQRPLTARIPCNIVPAFWASGASPEQLAEAFQVVAPMSDARVKPQGLLTRLLLASRISSGRPLYGAAGDLLELPHLGNAAGKRPGRVQ